MLEFLKDKKKKAVLLNSLLVIIGLLCAIIPNTAVSILETIVFICLIVYGLYCLLGYLLAPNDSKDINLLIESIVYLLCGALLSFIEDILIIFIGAYLIVEGLKEMVFAADMKTKLVSNWYVDGISGLVMVVVGIVIIVLARKTLTIISIITGVSLTVYGGLNLIRIFVLKRNYYDAKIIDFNEISKNKESQENGDENTSNKSTNPNDDDFTDYNIK